MCRNTNLGIDFEYSRSDPTTPDLAPTPPIARTIVFGVIPYIFRFKESIATIPEMFRALPNYPVRGIDYDYSRNHPSPPDLSRTLPKHKTTVFGVFAYIFRFKESIATIPEMIRAFPTFPEFSRFLRGIDCDYSRNDPSPPDLAPTLPKPETTVFGVFAYIFRCEESIATILETIRALSIWPELSRSQKPPCLVSLPRFPAGRCVAAGHAVGSEAATRAAKPPAGSAQPTPPASQS
ncbi:hypothetical protein NQ317_003192 [Molorchus minor]|uniref:Uncharacterized protein n=1 Tax=Molorchus minor TaxID=1323400 RepID=A0ABQ9JHN4_9CUCU|nr:hypothetical protein NQ317_003192 [Molorchus minor]